MNTGLIRDLIERGYYTDALRITEQALARTRGHQKRDRLHDLREWAERCQNEVPVFMETTDAIAAGEVAGRIAAAGIEVRMMKRGHEIIISVAREFIDIAKVAAAGGQQR